MHKQNQDLHSSIHDKVVQMTEQSVNSKNQTNIKNNSADLLLTDLFCPKVSFVSFNLFQMLLQ